MTTRTCSTGTPSRRTTSRPQVRRRPKPPDHEEKPPSLATERGLAEVFGIVLMGLAVVIVLVGLADAARRG